MATNPRGFYRAQAKVVLRNRMNREFGGNMLEMSVVDNRRLPNMPADTVAIISQDVYEIMRAIEFATHRDNAEVPFFLYGRVTGQTVVFDDIDADYSAGKSNLEAVFTERMRRRAMDFITDSPHDGTCIMAHGHTHPRIGVDYMNFSLGDMTSYAEMRYENPVFKNKSIELCSCLLVGGNYNFLFFDGNDYYKFNRVFVRSNDGKLTPLPCYGPDVAFTNNMGRGY